MNYETKSAILKALGHPIRLKMVVELSKGDGCNVNRIVENMNLPQSTVSQHLGILKANGIIYPRKDGVNTCYNIANKEVFEIIKILEK